MIKLNELVFLIILFKCKLEYFCKYVFNNKICITNIYSVENWAL